MRKKMYFSLSVAVFLLLTIVSNAFAETKYFAIYYQNELYGYSKASNELLKRSDNSVTATASTQVYSGVEGVSDSSTALYVSVSATKNGIFAGSDSDTAGKNYAAVVLLNLGTYSSSNSYSSGSAHYVYNQGGVKTGSGNITTNTIVVGTT